MNDNKNTFPSITFIDALALIFITLKLCGVIAWSWWLVLSPMLIEIGVLIIAILFIAIKQTIKQMCCNSNKGNKKDD